MKTSFLGIQRWGVLGFCAGLCLLIGLSTAAQPADEPPIAPPKDEAVSTPDAAPTATESRRAKRLSDVVAVGEDATVKAGQTADEVVVVRGNAELGGDVDGDVVVVFGRLHLTGTVDGDVFVVLGEAEVDGRINGELTTVLTQAKLGPQADVRGHIQSVGMPLDIDPSARIARAPEIILLGPFTKYLAGVRDYFFEGVIWLRPFPPGVGWVWIAAAVLLGLHLFLALVLAQPLQACMATLREQPARSFLIGLLACVLVGPVSILLSFTVVAPMLLLLVFFAACVFGRVTVYGAAGAAMGRALKSEALGHPLLAVLVGSLVFYVGYMIPFIGLLVYGLVVPLGVGAVSIRLFDAMRRERGPVGGIPSTANPPMSGGVSAANALATGIPGPATHAIPSAEAPSPDSTAIDATTDAEPQAPPPKIERPVPPPLLRLSGMEAIAQARVGFWPRIGASVIDWVLILVVNAVTFEGTKSFLILLTVYHVLMWAWRATTLGGAILNLRIVRLDGREFDWQTAIVRVLGAVVSILPLGLGFFWASWDPEYQSWHDRIAGTTIVKPDRRMALV